MYDELVKRLREEASEWCFNCWLDWLKQEA